MSEWNKARLGEIADPSAGSVAIGPFGSRMKAETYTATGVPVIRGTNISSDRAWKGDWVYVSDEFADSMPNCNVFAGDLVFPHRGSIGQIAVIPADSERLMLSTSLMKFRPDKSKVSPEFLYYYFRSNEGRSEILRFSSQVGTPGIGQPLSSLKQFCAPLPPLASQKAIASLLGALDDKIELNRRMNETLEGMARALFKDWFVDFGPTRAKMEGRPPYLAPHLWNLFPDKLDEKTGLPEGWRIGTVGDCVEKVQNGGTPKRSVAEYWSDGNIPWLTSGEVRQDIVISTENYITDAGLNNSSAKMLPEMIPLVALYGATAGQVSLSAIPLTTNQAISAVIPKENFRYYILTHLKLESENLGFSAVGSAQQNISKKIVEDLPIPLAKSLIIKTFDEYVEPLFESSVKNLCESKTLAQTRDLLLPRLMSGEIRLKDAEKEVEKKL